MAEWLPPPPSSFGIGPVLRLLKRDDEVWRIYFQGGRHPTAWNEFRSYGPTNSRFDHHTYPKREQGRAIVYGSAGRQAIVTCLAEVFQDTRHINTTDRDPWLCCFRLARGLKLLNTSSEWPVRAGGNMAINSGVRHRSREWSRAIYRHYPEVEGIWYPSSLTNQPSVALYERALSALPAAVTLNLSLRDPSLFGDLTHAASRLGYTMS